MNDFLSHSYLFAKYVYFNNKELEKYVTRKYIKTYIKRGMISGKMLCPEFKGNFSFCKKIKTKLTMKLNTQFRKFFVAEVF